MGVTLDFDTPPGISIFKMAGKRGHGVTIPRIEARARGLSGDLAAYSRVCGVPRGDTLPVCYPDLLCRGLQLAVLTHASFPLRLLGIVHLRQIIRQTRPIRVDEPLSGAVWVEGQRPARKGGEFDLTSEVRAGDEVVWTGVTTILSRDLPGDGVKQPTEQPPAFAPARSTAWALPEDLGRRYAKVSGDVNPIHQYAWTARPFGFSRAIIHGWWTLARCLAELDLPAAPTEVDARFSSPVFLPSTAWFSAGPSQGGHAFVLRTKDKPAVTGHVRLR